MQPGGRAPVKAPRNRAERKWGGAGETTPPPAHSALQQLWPCVFYPNTTGLSKSTHSLLPFAHNHTHITGTTPHSQVPLTHSECPITQGPCLPPLLPITLILQASAAKRLPPRSLSPSLVNELTDATLSSRPCAGRWDHRCERDPAYAEDVTVST